MSDITPEAAISIIKAMRPDTTKFQVRRRGYVDWKFGELAAYLGYQGAVDYVASVRRWIDFDKYEESLLITSHTAFLEAEKQYYMVEILESEAVKLKKEVSHVR